MKIQVGLLGDGPVAVQHPEDITITRDHKDGALTLTVWDDSGEYEVTIAAFAPGSWRYAYVVHEEG